MNHSNNGSCKQRIDNDIDIFTFCVITIIPPHLYLSTTDGCHNYHTSQLSYYCMGRHHVNNMINYNTVMLEYYSASAKSTLRVWGFQTLPLPLPLLRLKWCIHVLQKYHSDTWYDILYHRIWYGMRWDIHMPRCASKAWYENAAKKQSQHRPAPCGVPEVSLPVWYASTLPKIPLCWVTQSRLQRVPLPYPRTVSLPWFIMMVLV